MVAVVVLGGLARLAFLCNERTCAQLFNTQSPTWCIFNHRAAITAAVV